MDRNHLRLLTIGGIVALAMAVIVVIVRGDRSRDLVLMVEPVNGSGEITVYAGGAVATPGLYTMPRGSRVASLIDQSGLAESADTTKLQMAAELRDGQEIIVPTQSVTTPKAAASPTPSPTTIKAEPVDINTASVAELDQLSGIGPTLAQRIVDYRNAHGPFVTVDALANVQGISARMVDDFRNQVTVGP